MFQGVLFSGRSRRYEQYTRNNGVVFFGRQRGVYHIGAIGIMGGGYALTWPLAMGLTPRDLYPAYIKGNGVRSLEIGVIPVFDDIRIAWEVFVVIYHGFKMAQYTQYGMRGRGIITTDNVIYAIGVN